MPNNVDCLVVGGGASGFFFAINYAEKHPENSLMILEKSKNVLQKVKISGGGRCNVTHAEFEPMPLTTNYPRGEKELIGPFHTFMTGDMMAWLNDKGVKLKIEDDGRIFPVSDSSQTIIDCFVNETERLGINVKTSENVLNFEFIDNRWHISTKTNTYSTKQFVISTGSSKKIWDELERLGHQIVKPVPSLFTFNIDYPQLTKLQGLSIDSHICLFKDENCSTVLLESDGATLITHWGLSGPCVLKLSAWGAKLLHEIDYKFYISVNWLPGYGEDNILKELEQHRSTFAKKKISNQVVFNLPKRFWNFILEEASVNPDKKWAELSKKEILALMAKLTANKLQVDGKSTFKEEFVTSGGIDLKEIDFKTYNSKKLPQLKILGEALNVDAITGGFNFQNAWTSAYIAANTY
jgi:predicted Rossmann fold flavoprotein